MRVSSSGRARERGHASPLRRRGSPPAGRRRSPRNKAPAGDAPPRRARRRPRSRQKPADCQAAASANARSTPSRVERLARAGGRPEAERSRAAPSRRARAPATDGPRAQPATAKTRDERGGRDDPPGGRRRMRTKRCKQSEDASAAKAARRQLAGQIEAGLFVGSPRCGATARKAAASAACETSDGERPVIDVDEPRAMRVYPTAGRSRRRRRRRSRARATASGAAAPAHKPRRRPAEVDDDGPRRGVVGRDQQRGRHRRRQGRDRRARARAAKRAPAPPVRRRRAREMREPRR